MVVKPEIVSKKASVNNGIDFVSKNGRVPNNENKSHPAVTITYPSRRFNSSCDFLTVRYMKAPIPEVMAPDNNNCNESFSLKMSDTGMDNHIKIPSVIRIRPKIRMMVRVFSITTLIEKLPDGVDRSR